MIPRDAADCPYCGANTIRQAGQKECPFCGELVRGKAVKCKHCGEFLDGRPTGQEEPQQILYVDKAIIAGRRPDGSLELIQPEDAAELEGSEEVVGRLTDGARKQLPAGEQADLPARREAPVPAPTAPSRVPQRAPHEAEAPSPPQAGPELLARYECPSCGRYVYEGDSFCENCGRDLSLRRDRPEIKPSADRYEPADYALMVAAGSPAGLLVAPMAALLLAGAGGALSAWSLWRILGSRGRFSGRAVALGGLAAALFWAAVVLALG
jgi:hypothetical protein